jgi:flagellar basal body-associated protein FliL
MKMTDITNETEPAKPFLSILKNYFPKGKNTQIALVASIVVVLGGGIYAMPFFIVNGLKEALAKQDATQVSQHIDFVNLRTNLKSMIRSQIMAKAMQEQQQGNPLGMMGAGLGNAYVDGIVDQFLSPTGVATLFQLSKASPQANSQNWVEQAQQQTKISMGYEGVNHFAVKLEDKKNSQAVMHLVFWRDGLSWKLADVRLSDALLSQSGSL